MTGIIHCATNVLQSMLSDVHQLASITQGHSLCNTCGTETLSKQMYVYTKISQSKLYFIVHIFLDFTDILHA